jgi:hypothetical protein
VATVTGWLAAKGCSQAGMVWVGTNTELLKASGNTPMKTPAWTASALRTTRPRGREAKDRLYGPAL